MAEGVRFELTREQSPLPVFKTGALNHSATLPCPTIEHLAGCATQHKWIVLPNCYPAVADLRVRARVFYCAFLKLASAVRRVVRGRICAMARPHWVAGQCQRSRASFIAAGALLTVAPRPILRIALAILGSCRPLRAYSPFAPCSPRTRHPSR